MTHNSSVNFKLIHILLWIKGSQQSPNFETFKCSGEILSYSSCHFPNHKSVFLQILHHSSVLWKMTCLYFFWSNFIYFAQKESIKVEIWEFRVIRSKFTKFLSYLSNKSVFLQILHHSSVSRGITPLYLFNWNFLYMSWTKRTYQSTNLVKFHISSQKSEVLHFDGFLLSKPYEASAKTVKKNYLS